MKGMYVLIGAVLCSVIGSVSAKPKFAGIGKRSEAASEKRSAGLLKGLKSKRESAAVRVVSSSGPKGIIRGRSQSSLPAVLPAPKAAPRPTAFQPAPAPLLEASAKAGLSDKVSGKFTLEQCLDMAIERSHAPKVSTASKMIAEAQHRQALAAYWPHFTMSGFASLRSNEPNFQFPGMSVATPALQFATPEMSFSSPELSVRTPATSINLPAGTLGPGSPAIAVPVGSQNIKVPSQNIAVPSQSITVPAGQLEVQSQEFDLADRASYGAQIEAKWLMADGGERRARRKRAMAGVEAAGHGQRASLIALSSDVRRYYQSAVMAAALTNIAEDVLERMESTLELTKTFYEGGSMKVTRMDYLSNKVSVDALRSGIEMLNANYELACSALAHSMGLGFDSRIEPSETKLRFKRLNTDLPELVGQSYHFSPDWGQLLAGLEAAQQAVKGARAGFAPKVALLGKIHAIENGPERGFSTEENLNAWEVGVGVELPLFRGFLTKNQLDEAKAELKKMEHQQVLLEEGLAMQVKKSFIDLTSAQRREHKMAQAVASARENRDLTDRAYRAGMTDADKIFEALIMDALARAQKLKVQYDAVAARIALDAAVGEGFTKLLEGTIGK